MQKPIDLREVRENAAALLGAIEVIERQYPGYRLELVPVSIPQGQPVSLKKLPRLRKFLTALPPPQSSKRDLVRQAVSGKWATIEEIRETTGLTTKQIYGVLTSPDAKETFQRRTMHGQKKEFKLREPSTEANE